VDDFFFEGSNQCLALVTFTENCKTLPWSKATMRIRLTIPIKR
jgi:hypothetical protein